MHPDCTYMACSSTSSSSPGGVVTDRIEQATRSSLVQHRDGPVARGERTRAAIVAAHADLLRDGVLKPTGAEVAARAGVSVRALWQNFGDLEGLLVATTRWWQESDAALVAPIDPTLPTDQRIDSY